MHLRTRRGIALLSATAALAGASLTTVTPASAADGRTSGARLALIDLGLGDLLNGILGTITDLTSLDEVRTLIAPLTGEQVGDLLQSASPVQLTKLLAARWARSAPPRPASCWRR
jgi:hypothetical protein